MRRARIFLAMSVLCIGRAAVAQCAWQPGTTLWGLNGDVNAIAVLPNGDVIVGGSFTQDGASHALQHVARLSGRMWVPVGSGLPGEVNALAVLPSGDLIAGGAFTLMPSGGTPGFNVARWNGSEWTPIGEGMYGGAVSALAVTTEGDVIAGGSFATISHTYAGLPDVAASRIALWDGTTWNPMGSGMTGSYSPFPLYGSVAALTLLQNGDLIAGGEFTSAGGVPAFGIARWDGSAWHSMGAGTNYPVLCLATLTSGDVVAGGTFSSAGGRASNYIARWTPATALWTPMSSGLLYGVASLLALPEGELIAGGYFTLAGSQSVLRLARWNGLYWNPSGEVHDGAVFALAMRPDGVLVAGGTFTSSGGSAGEHIAQWGCYCSADLDNDGNYFSGAVRDGAVTIDDLLFFLTAFERSSFEADLDNGSNTGTPDAAVDINDLLFFLAHFEAGC